MTAQRVDQRERQISVTLLLLFLFPGLGQAMAITMLAEFWPNLWIEGPTPALTELADLENLRVGVHQGSTEPSVLPLVVAQGDIDPSEADVAESTSMYIVLREERTL